MNDASSAAASAAVVQAMAAVFAMIATMVLAAVAIPALRAAKTQADAGRAQADSSARSVEEAERARLLAAMPVVTVGRIEKRMDGNRTFLVLELVCEASTPALQVKTALAPLNDQRQPVVGAFLHTAAEVPVLGAQRLHAVAIEVSSISNTSGGVGYSWMQISVEYLGLLGAKVKTVLEFAPNDALNAPPGTPGFGQRFTLTGFEADLDGTGRYFVRLPS